MGKLFVTSVSEGKIMEKQGKWIWEFFIVVVHSVNDLGVGISLNLQTHSQCFRLCVFDKLSSFNKYIKTLLNAIWPALIITWRKVLVLSEIFLLTSIALRRGITWGIQIAMKHLTVLPLMRHIHEFPIRLFQHAMHAEITNCLRLISFVNNKMQLFIAWKFVEKLFCLKERGTKEVVWSQLRGIFGIGTKFLARWHIGALLWLLISTLSSADLNIPSCSLSTHCGPDAPKHENLFAWN